MIPLVIRAYKNLGETPLACLERTRKQLEIPFSVPMTYAGRLDPMAEGLLILLTGEECKNKQHYLGLDKTYEFEVLMGFETDTYDLLGLVALPKEEFERSSGRPLDLNQTISNFSFGFAQAFKDFVGTFIQTYPPFSSKTSGGTQLFQHSKNHTLPEVLPIHKVTIKSLVLINKKIISKKNIQEDIIKRVTLVEGDFRQNEIIELWNHTFKQCLQEEFIIFSCIAECSSGTYIRQLVKDISEKINIPLVTYSIKRTKIGEYLIPASRTD